MYFRTLKIKHSTNGAYPYLLCAVRDDYGLGDSQLHRLDPSAASFCKGPLHRNSYDNFVPSHLSWELWYGSAGAAVAPSFFSQLIRHRHSRCYPLVQDGFSPYQ